MVSERQKHVMSRHTPDTAAARGGISRGVWEKCGDPRVSFHEAKETTDGAGHLTEAIYSNSFSHQTFLAAFLVI